MDVGPYPHIPAEEPGMPRKSELSDGATVVVDKLQTQSKQSHAALKNDGVNHIPRAQSL